MMTIKEIRDTYGLTQQKLSDVTGIPKRTIENWEGGKRKPPEYLPNLILSRLIILYGEFSKAGD